MTALFKVYVCTVLLTMVSVSPVSADTSWETLRRFGLTGVWAYFCERPASQINYFETYAGGPNGLARREVDRGIDVPVAGFDDFHFNSDADIRGGERRSAIGHAESLPVVAILYDI